jgi:DNA-binding MarR family transcriptional regulator
MADRDALSVAFEPPDRITDHVIKVDHAWRVTEIDADSRERLGFGDECLGRDIRELFPLSAATHARDILQRALDDGEETRFRFYGRELGSWFDIRIRPVAAGAEIAFRDLVEAGDETGSVPLTDPALNRIADEMRRMADSISQGVLIEPDSAAAPSAQNWNDGRLARFAEAIYRDRRRRDKLLAIELGEPQWDILLDLFIQATRGNQVSVTSACIAADVPSSTALRALDQLRAAGLVSRTEDLHDKRRVLVALSRTGMDAMRSFLRQSALAAREMDS